MPAIQNRHVVALPRGNKEVFLSWRLLKTDPANAAFFVEHMVNGTWRFPTDEAVVDATTIQFPVDDSGPQQFRIIAPDGTPSETATVDPTAEASLIARAHNLDPDARVQGVVIGDLQNNGRYGFVVRSAKGGTVWMTAIGMDGDRLWEIDTNLPERGGWDGSMHHVPFLAWDLNGDGRTEVAFHSFGGAYPKDTYDEAVDGERFTVVDGETGDRVWETNWQAIKSRVMMTVGHLDGIDEPASVVVLDETYGDVTMTALNGVDGTVKWRVDQARGAGHNLDIGDIDEDGVQEVICGGICYNGDGSKRWEAEPFGHTDLSKPCRIDPSLPGMQIWYAVEKENTGVYLVDKDGQTQWKHPFKHAHYGWIARHAPGVDGLHPHTAEDSRRVEQDHYPVYLPDGSTWLNLTDWQRKNFVPVHWDERPEVAFVIRKEDKRVVRLLASGEIEDLTDSKLPETAEYGRNLGCVDVLGDARENIVTVDPVHHQLLVLANPNRMSSRSLSPTESFEYRHDRSQLGSGYYIYLSPPIL
ncbi:TPA: hypothetical protein DCE37_06465 [Candidatus Latescibacteria bacterium]|nr:hypothetical protein [Candidatus Latescibacterota bacterium]